MENRREAVVLPYKNAALEPVMSKETIDTHFGKHYINYLNKYNELKESHAEFKESSLEDVIRHSEGPLFNNAAQVLNHELFFLQFAGEQIENNSAKGVLLDAINNHFGSFDELVKLMTQRAASLFGSGWVWLALDSKNLVVVNGSNAYTPILEDMQPLMAIDVWEHAYYIDYREKRAEYLDKFWSIINWHTIEERYVYAAEHGE